VQKSIRRLYGDIGDRRQMGERQDKKQIATVEYKMGTIRGRNKYENISIIRGLGLRREDIDNGGKNPVNNSIGIEIQQVKEDEI
jgi:hypothetical protein